MEATSLAFPITNVPCILDTDIWGRSQSRFESKNGWYRTINCLFLHTNEKDPEEILHDTTRTSCSCMHSSTLPPLPVWHQGHPTHRSLQPQVAFKMPEGILAPRIEILAEFDIEIEHRPGLLYSNVDGMSRPFCKQCFGKELWSEWVDELERADKLDEPLGVQQVSILPEISDEEIQELQGEDTDISPVVEWMRLGRCLRRSNWSQSPRIPGKCRLKSPLFIFLTKSLFGSPLRIHTYNSLFHAVSVNDCLR